MSCPSSRSSCRSLSSACLRYSMSVPVAYHRVTFPFSSMQGLYRMKPPILTVFPASPLLVFERNRARETFLLFAKSFSVFWMKDALPEVIGAHFVQRQTCVVKCLAICIDGFPIRIQDNDCLCDRIHHAKKLFFILKKLGLCA